MDHMACAVVWEDVLGMSLRQPFTLVDVTCRPGLRLRGPVDAGRAGSLGVNPGPSAQQQWAIASRQRRRRRASATGAVTTLMARDFTIATNQASAGRRVERRLRGHDVRGRPYREQRHELRH